MSYDIVKAGLDQLEGRLNAALRNDIEENLQVVARMVSAGNLLAPALAAGMMADAWNVHSSVTATLRKINDHGAWLARSASSETSLKTAIERWSDIGLKQSQIIAQIAAGKDRLTAGQWRGMSRGDYLNEVAKMQEKEAAFAKSLACIVDGCRMSLTLTEWIMVRASGHVDRALLNTSAATTMPSGASTQPRNWRLRNVAARFSTLEGGLQTLRNKSDWRRRERIIVDIFEEHATTLAVLQAGSGPLTVYAV